MYGNRVFKIKLFHICIEMNIIIYLSYSKEPKSRVVIVDCKESAVINNKLQSIRTSTLRLLTRMTPTHTGRLPNNLA
jgi:hypothetical protein